MGCGACVSEFLQLGAKWVGEDRGGDTERDHPQPPGAQPGGTELPSGVPRVQNEATLPGLQCVGGVVPLPGGRWWMGPSTAFPGLGCWWQGPLLCPPAA